MIRIGIFVLAAVLAPVPSDATVYEYGRDGQVIVNSSPGVGTSAPRLAELTPSRAVYRAMAEKIALRHASGDGPRTAGLDALTFTRLFVELIRVESAFNPRAISPKGARGLGQLMPATARALGVGDAFDPAENLDGAARYFAAQLERFGDVTLALAAYNAGPHRVVQYGGVPPFPETRAYVARITAAMGQAPKLAARSEPRSVFSTRTRKDLSVWQY